MILTEQAAALVKPDFNIREIKNACDKLVFCTLFDSNYLDKGIVLYKSMNKRMKNFKLYIFALDNKCFEILYAMNLDNVVVVSVECIMTNRLRQIKGERTRAEFCWTCTAATIEYVLLTYKEKMCTYLDADIYFFADPSAVIDEIIEKNCSVGLVQHGFERDYEYARHILHVGKYCIQFNTFLNNEEGLYILREWKKNCLDWCYHRFEDDKFGDQKYPDKWKYKYNCVHDYQNLGAGVAPWNLHLYSYKGKKNGTIWMEYRHNQFPLIFYHFEGMKYLANHNIFLNLWKWTKLGTGKKVKLFYGEYVRELERTRKYLKKYHNIEFKHMIADEHVNPIKRYSCRSFCVENGVIGGICLWIGFKKNNILNVKNI